MPFKLAGGSNTTQYSNYTSDSNPFYFIEKTDSSLISEESIEYFFVDESTCNGFENDKSCNDQRSVQSIQNMSFTNDTGGSTSIGSFDLSNSPENNLTENQPKDISSQHELCKTLRKRINEDDLMTVDRKNYGLIDLNENLSPPRRRLRMDLNNTLDSMEDLNCPLSLHHNSFSSPPILVKQGKSGQQLFTRACDDNNSKNDCFVSPSSYCNAAPIIKHTTLTNSVFKRCQSLCSQQITSAIESRDVHGTTLSGNAFSTMSLPLSRKTDIHFVSIDSVAAILRARQTPTSLPGSSGCFSPWLTSLVSCEMCIVDCRYEFEHRGGHIIGAVNVGSALISLDECLRRWNRSAYDHCSSTILVLHCEFSSQRAPALARHIRNEDRKYNFARYPFLFFPEIYVIDGGYAQFFKKYPELCEPRQYISMFDPQFGKELRKEKQMSLRRVHTTTAVPVAAAAANVAVPRSVVMRQTGLLRDTDLDETSVADHDDDKLAD